jgi:hypothetical protein
MCSVSDATFRRHLHMSASPEKWTASGKVAAKVSLGRFHPSADDFAMLQLLLMTVLPQLGGLVLLVTNRT